MTDWRYWITYSGRVHTESEDEDVATAAVWQAHEQNLHAGVQPLYEHVEVEMEEIEND